MKFKNLLAYKMLKSNFNQFHKNFSENLPRSLERITSHKGYWFKFVVSKEEDLDEIENDFIKPFNIDPKRVLMMPGLDHQDNFHERTKFILELAGKHGYIGLTRLHISAWNQTTGV